MSVATIDWGECLVPSVVAPSPLQAEVRATMGVVPGWLARVAPSAWMSRAFARFATHPLAYLRPDLADLIGFVVSQDNSCRYCFGIQRAMYKVFGWSDERLAALERDVYAAALAAADRAALDFARKLSRANPRPGPADYQALRKAGFAPAAIAEIAFMAAIAAFNNRCATLLALPPEPFEKQVDRPLFRLMRPLVARQMRRHKPPPVAPPPQPDRGPCARVVAALGDSPAAGILRATIDEAWASDVLPRRTRALMFGVVGKALDCAGSVTEARALAEGEGVAPAGFDEVLAHLASPTLDGRERLLVPFARETARYQVGPIQARTREVAAALAPGELLEAVGTASLANAVCRLSVLLDAC